MSKSKETVNLSRVRAALDRIELLLTEHPELRERTADYLSGELPGLEDTMGMRALTIRMPEDLLARAEELAERLQVAREADPLHEGSRTATAADVIRVALRRGIDLLDEELPSVGSKPSRKPRKAAGKRGKKKSRGR